MLGALKNPIRCSLKVVQLKFSAILLQRTDTNSIMQPISLYGKFKNGCIEFGPKCKEEQNFIRITEQNIQEQIKEKPYLKYGLYFPLDSRKLKVGDVFRWELALTGGHGFSINIRYSHQYD